MIVIRVYTLVKNGKTKDYQSKDHFNLTLNMEMSWFSVKLSTCIKTTRNVLKRILKQNSLCVLVRLI